MQKTLGTQIHEIFTSRIIGIALRAGIMSWTEDFFFKKNRLRT